MSWSVLGPPYPKGRRLNNGLPHNRLPLRPATDFHEACHSEDGHNPGIQCRTGTIVSRLHGVGFNDLCTMSVCPVDSCS